MISKLTIIGFRGISKIEVEGLQKINIFVGANNSGKTTILEALYLLVNPIDHKALWHLNSLRNLNVSEKPWELFFNQLDVKPKFTLKGEFEAPFEVWK